MKASKRKWIIHRRTAVVTTFHQNVEARDVGEHEECGGREISVIQKILYLEKTILQDGEIQGNKGNYLLLIGFYCKNAEV